MAFYSRVFFVVFFLIYQNPEPIFAFRLPSLCTKAIQILSKKHREYKIKIVLNKIKEATDGLIEKSYQNLMIEAHRARLEHPELSVAEVMALIDASEFLPTFGVWAAPQLDAYKKSYQELLLTIPSEDELRRTYEDEYHFKWMARWRRRELNILNELLSDIEAAEMDLTASLKSQRMNYGQLSRLTLLFILLGPNLRVDMHEFGDTTERMIRMIRTKISYESILNKFAFGLPIPEIGGNSYLQLNKNFGFGLLSIGNLPHPKTTADVEQIAEADAQVFNFKNFPIHDFFHAAGLLDGEIIPEFSRRIKKTTLKDYSIYLLYLNRFSKVMRKIDSLLSTLSARDQLLLSIFIHDMLHENDIDIASARAVAQIDLFLKSVESKKHLWNNYNKNLDGILSEVPMRFRQEHDYGVGFPDVNSLTLNEIYEMAIKLRTAITDALEIQK
ncbi:MAG: hypothetical protein JWQ35_1529 [Bacteriovoracaceae bacterium]|nr:hypothetical protein [Bacteriovoracaceae bacterium]